MIFRILSQLGREITLEEKVLDHILEHPEMKGQLSRIKEAAMAPDAVHKSIRVKDIALFYKLFEKTPVGKKYICVVAKLINYEYHIITAYYTDRIKEGDKIWP